MRDKWAVFKNLRPKIAVVFTLIFFTTGWLVYFITNNVLLHNVLQIEEQLINENIQRVRNILNDEVERLKVLSLDWGHWDETYEFALNRNPYYIKQNLFADAFFSNQWSFYLLFSKDFQLTYYTGFNLENKKPQALPADYKHYFYIKSPFFRYKSEIKPEGGIIYFNNNIQFVASITIRHSDRKGPTVGYLILMRPLNLTRLKGYSNALELPLSIQPLSLTDKNKQAALIKEFTEDHTTVFQKNEILVKLLIRDIYDAPIAILSFKMNRDIYKYSEQAIYLFIGLLAIIFFICLFALWIMINLIVLKRIALFNNQITAIANQGGYSKRVYISGQDELSFMADKVNALLNVIGRVHNALENRMITIEQINKELKSIEEENRHIIEYAPEPIIITDSSNHIKLVNKAATKVFKIKKQELVGQPIDSTFLIKQNKDESGKGVISDVKAHDVQKEYLITYRNMDIPVELKTALLNNDSTIFILRDISERKAYEKEVALLNQKLVFSSRQAGMSDVSTMLLHNIGNILSSVLVTVSVMKESFLNSKVNSLEKVGQLLEEHQNDLADYLTKNEKGEKIPEYLCLLTKLLKGEHQTFIAQLTSLNESIDKIMLVINNFQFKQGASVVEKFNITELMDNVLEIHSERIKKHRVKLSRHYCECRDIMQDKFKIWHILNNLVTNAIDALKEVERERNLCIEIEKQAESIKLKVVDNGIGIPSVNLVSIFMFNQTSKVGGHGIGLHSSSILAEQIGGKLSVESPGLGEGATFILEIPYEPPKK
ncbi:sensor histidine kinase [Legionella birminghamensis]|uniref:histidine kinase n=1 Tax=Legionella birminghamensis TaxID=28083 RepID=A0A378IBS7_9GAMM|nr:CHASE4 domain-containing protein [Legionella birminghamensis]KTC73057.1 sensor histidine kinase [Legionella birminghamensis]STX32366.1 sensor histidine kinase [Legionella birminghamensis]